MWLNRLADFSKTKEETPAAAPKGTAAFSFSAPRKAQSRRGDVRVGFASREWKAGHAGVEESALRRIAPPVVADHAVDALVQLHDPGRHIARRPPGSGGAGRRWARGHGCVRALMLLVR